MRSFSAFSCVIVRSSPFVASIWVSADFLDSVNLVMSLSILFNKSSLSLSSLSKSGLTVSAISFSILSKSFLAADNLVSLTKMLSLHSWIFLLNSSCLSAILFLMSSIIKSDLVNFSSNSLRPLGLNEENLFGIPCPMIIVEAIKSWVKSGSKSPSFFSLSR